MDVSIKNRQWILLGGIAVVLLGGGLLYVFLAWSPSSKTNPDYKNSLTTGISRLNPQEAWVYKFGNEAEVTKKRLDALEDMFSKMLRMNAQKSGDETKPPAANASLETSSSLIAAVREDLKTQRDLPSQEISQGFPQGIAKELPFPPAPTGFPEPQGELKTRRESMRSRAVRKISFSLKNSRKALKSVDNTIPAGAFARAVLLGGVDASASIQAASDPRPALLRIMDEGTLPRHFYSDLKGCHVLAACYGDISSERVMMRLEKLSCTEKKTGEVIELKVQGYVAGEDGRTGLRGSVVDRAGESMRNALMGGFVSGIGEFLSQSRNPLTFSPASGLAQTNPMGVGEMVKHGTGKGVSSALDKYADFYIKRAEQVQPVIQVAAGRIVDIVFTEGISLTDTLYRQTTSRSHDEERYQQLQAETPQKPVQEWTQPQKE